MTTIVSLADDPVYDAIRQYRAAGNALDNYAGGGTAFEYARLEQTFFDTQAAFLDCIPTTGDGLRVKIAAFLDSPASVVSGEGLRPFLDTLYQAARLMALTPAEPCA
jgi:hypothetical protein